MNLRFMKQQAAEYSHISVSESDDSSIASGGFCGEGFMAGVSCIGETYC